MRLFTVDAFTDRPFGGNPAGVALLDAPPDDEAFLRALATEMALSETAFVWPTPDGAFGLRWLTPTTEVDLCGHATLATAHVLWQERLADPDAPLAFDTRSGRLTCRRTPDARVKMNFPSTPPAEADPPPGLAEALGTAPVWTGRTRFDLFVRLPDDDAVRALAPDLAALTALGTRGVIVTAPSDNPAFDFVSRFFAPGAGVPEDPVTGSAHCALAPYWAAETGRAVLRGWQASARGGAVEVEPRGDRVLLRGHAVTMFELTGPVLTRPDARGRS